MFTNKHNEYKLLRLTQELRSGRSGARRNREHVWSSTLEPDWPRHLCYRPAEFFCHFPLIELSLAQVKIKYASKQMLFKYLLTSFRTA